MLEVQGLYIWEADYKDCSQYAERVNIFPLTDRTS